MTLIDRVESLQRVWKVVMPHLPEPASTDVLRWCNYPDAVIEQAIFRTGKKFAVNKIGPNFEPAQAYRYVTGTARLMTQEQSQRERIHGR